MDVNNSSEREQHAQPFWSSTVGTCADWMGLGGIEWGGMGLNQWGLNHHQWKNQWKRGEAMYVDVDVDVVCNL